MKVGDNVHLELYLPIITRYLLLFIKRCFSSANICKYLPLSLKCSYPFTTSLTGANLGTGQLAKTMRKGYIRQQYRLFFFTNTNTNTIQQHKSAIPIQSQYQYNTINLNDLVLFVWLYVRFLTQFFV